MSDVAIAKNLRAAGFTQEQAEVLAESISNGIADGAATKLDIVRLEAKLDKLESRINAIFAMLLVVLGVVLAQFIKSIF